MNKISHTLPSLISGLIGLGLAQAAHAQVAPESKEVSLLESVKAGISTSPRLASKIHGLEAMIQEARQRPKKRIATGPSQSAKRKRVDRKKKHGTTKQQRQKPDW